MANPFYIVTSNILESSPFHFLHADTKLILVYEVVSYWCLELLNFRFSQTLKISHRRCIFLSYEFYLDKCPIMNIVFPLLVVVIFCRVNLEPHACQAGTLPLNYIPKPLFCDEVKFVSVFYWLCFWSHIWVDHYQISSQRFIFSCTFVSELNFTSVFTVRCLCCFCRYFFSCLSWLGLRN